MRHVLLLGALAEESRLQVLATVVLGASKAPEIAKATGLSASEVERSLSRLATTRLIKTGNVGFVVDNLSLKEVVRERQSAERQTEPTAAFLGATPEQAVVLERFLAPGAGSPAFRRAGPAAALSLTSWPRSSPLVRSTPSAM